MKNLQISDLLKKTERTLPENAGTSRRKNIDKNCYVYHVITNTWSKRKLFYHDVAKYRHDLLCKLCNKNGITILFQTTMGNHSHEVFLTPDWETLALVVRSLNINVSKYVRKHYAERTKNGKKVFDNEIVYIPVKDISYLFFLGKYIFDNPKYLVEEGGIAPFSCFWMFEKSHFVTGYDADIYAKLFDLQPTEIFRIYSTMTKEEVMEYSKKRFSAWTEEDNLKLFTRT